MKFLPRREATEFLRGHGVPVGDGALKDHAYRGEGPRYCIVNGRALYTEADLLDWLANQAARPVCKRSRAA